jgi:hypothetical protein
MMLTHSDLPSGRIKNCTLSFRRVASHITSDLRHSTARGIRGGAYNMMRDGRASLVTFYLMWDMYGQPFTPASPPAPAPLPAARVAAAPGGESACAVPLGSVAVYPR